MSAFYDRRTTRGIALMTVALVIVAVGLFLGAVAARYQATRDFERNELTRQRLAKIQKAVTIFIQKNKRAPCVAGRSHGIDTADYGREQADCSLSPGSPNDFSETAGGTVQIGAVPVRSLNLPDEMMYDAWGNQFGYAVTKSMTLSPAAYTANPGVLQIVDVDATATLMPDAMYAVYSYGPDGRGARTRNGVVQSACAAGSRDSENCDDTNTTFRAVLDEETNTSLYATAGTAAHYDDFLVYSDKKSVFLYVVKDYFFEEFPCNNAEGAISANPLGQNCATLAMSGVDHPSQGRNYGISFGPDIGGVDGNQELFASGKNLIRTYGRPLYTSSARTAKTGGKVLVRATIPVRYDNTLAELFPNSDSSPPWAYINKPIYQLSDAGIVKKPFLGIMDRRWEQAFMAAVYLRKNGVLDTNPLIIGDLINPLSTIATDSAGAAGSLVTEFQVQKNDTYQIEIYVFSSQNSIRNVSAWAGTIRLEDYQATAYIEFMELGAT